jgi:cytochrome c553
VLFAAAVLAAWPTLAQDTQGRNLAAGCAICHGTNGRAVKDSGFASLAGLERGYLVEQMRAFRDGKRPATVMQQLARGYSDAQIDLLAAWFAAQKR